jgi:NADH dehydrogenase (ubiquinone) 1 beta subcomplex subunit 9
MSPIPGIKGFVTNRRLEDDLDADSDAQALLTETEKLLESWKHPDPYTPPTAPGGISLQHMARVVRCRVLMILSQAPSLSETSRRLFSTVSTYPVTPSHQ